MAHGVQVVSIGDDHTYHLNEAELSKILMNETTKDLPVALVSVAGAYRGGKSFLLNYFIRYLSSSPSARSDGTWVGDENKSLTGFTWQGGSVRITTGILMWSEPFVITLPSGTNVAVLLMDTQGTFDSTSSVKDCSAIFALSSLVASTQIYNIKTNISEDDLNNLQLFAEYGSLMKDETGKAFQELEFLIRDWMNPWEFAYGQVGGEKYLAIKLKTNPGQPRELRELRERILASFEKVTCFLMPHPGLQVANPKFQGKISEISQAFTNELKELASSIFSPEKLCMKLIGGRPVKCHELLDYFKSYMTVFNSNTIPSPTTILQATSSAGLQMAAKQVREQFDRNMQRACGSEAPGMPASEVQNLHLQELALARSTFKNIKLLGNTEDIDKKIEELIQELSKRQTEFIEINRLKTWKAIENGNAAYKKSIEAVTLGKPLCVHAFDIQMTHDDAVAAAITAFNVNRKIGRNGEDEDRDKFSKDLTAKYGELELTNEHNNKTMVAELRSEYFEYIMDQVKSLPNLCGNSFADKHSMAKSKALLEFEARRNKPNSYDTDVHKSNLIEAIELQYVQAQNINNSNNQNTFKSALVYFNSISIQPRDLDVCVFPSSLWETHDENKKRTFNSILPRQLCGNTRQILLEHMEQYYQEIKEINNLANERAVERAYRIYKSKFNELTDYWYYPLSSWDTARNYHDQAYDVAERYFYDSRSGGRYSSLGHYDRYLVVLIDKCSDYFRRT